ncbi:MAG: hypothetical protein COB20_15720 [SAR86 cluster bacterium]|uniref:Uncharacterized protein n=1 Tax=SAR86 cluster bacterium TaxID=2030880 RepID=A0A2A4WUH9_9GAMM|nr:MAG: hypothetical protein COB20_15720 [SAR86 cluster bacterium]
MILKRVLLSLSIVGALVVSQAASADNRNHRRGYGDYGYSQHNYGSRYRSNYRGNRRANSYHYGAHDRRYRNYNRHYSSGFNFSYGNYYSRHRGYDSGSFLGGLVLGSLFSSPRYSSRNVETVVYRNAPATRTREIVYVEQSQTRSTAAPIASGRRLLRDLEGNCFERIVDEQGDEIRVQLEAQECNF